MQSTMGTGPTGVTGPATARKPRVPSLTYPLTWRSKPPPTASLHQAYRRLCRRVCQLDIRPGMVVTDSGDRRRRSRDMEATGVMTTGAADMAEGVEAMVVEAGFRVGGEVEEGGTRHVRSVCWSVGRTICVIHMRDSHQLRSCWRFARGRASRSDDR